MGKFGIGARVRDDGGDEGVIVEKAKGQRRVRYDDADYGNLWQPKARLTALPANDNICAETSENAYFGSVDGAVSAWMPKVGDRVRYKTDGEEVPVIEVLPDGKVKVRTANWGVCTERKSSLEPVVAPATTALQIEAGKFYRTRDGRKVGPMEDHPHLSDLVWAGSHLTARYRSGRCNHVVDSPDDFVAEWVEPVPEVVVAEATATPWSGQGKPGLVVRCDEWGGELFTPGRVYTFDANGEVAANDGSKFEGIWAGKFSIVEPAAPPAKFKVGDRVEFTDRCASGWFFGPETKHKTGVVRTVDAEGNVTTADVDGADNWGFVSNEHVTLLPAIPTGSTVNFTANGRLSAYTEDGHAMIVFPGLTPGQNSFALPAKFVAAA